MADRRDYDLLLQSPLRRERAPAGDAPASPPWLVDELLDAWRAAQDEARAAAEQWRRLRGRDAYAVYLAAQDRADAAQDALARLVPATRGALA